jgi:hypothetical protein
MQLLGDMKRVGLNSMALPETVVRRHYENEGYCFLVNT